MDASELHARRLNAKEVLVPKSGDEFIFHCADGTVKLAAKDKEVPTSILTVVQHASAGLWVSLSL